MIEVESGVHREVEDVLNCLAHLFQLFLRLPQVLLNLVYFVLQPRFLFLELGFRERVRVSKLGLENPKPITLSDSKRTFLGSKANPPWVWIALSRRNLHITRRNLQIIGLHIAGPQNLLFGPQSPLALHTPPLDGLPLDGLPLDGLPLDGLPLDGLPLEPKASQKARTPTASLTLS